MKYIIDSEKIEWREAPAPLPRCGKLLHDGVSNPELANVSMGLFKFKPGEKGLSHRHSVETEIFYTTKGMGTLVIYNKEYLVKEGTLAIVPPGIDHYPINNGNVEWEYLAMFSPASDMSFVNGWKKI